MSWCLLIVCRATAAQYSVRYGLNFPASLSSAYLFPIGLMQVAWLGVYFGIVALAGYVLPRSKLLSSGVILSAVILFGAWATVTLKAPAEVWPSVLAAYRASSAESRHSDLASIWQGRSGHLSYWGWVRVSKKWGFCHGLWLQSGCTPAPGPLDSQGIARDHLQRAVGHT